MVVETRTNPFLGVIDPAPEYEPAETVIRLADEHEEPTDGDQWPRKEKPIAMETTSQLSKALSDQPSAVLREQGISAVHAGEPSAEIDPNDSRRGGSGLTEMLSNVLSATRDTIAEKTRDLLPHPPAESIQQDTASITTITHENRPTSKMDRDDDAKKMVR